MSLQGIQGNTVRKEKRRRLFFYDFDLSDHFCQQRHFLKLLIPGE